MPPVIIPVIVHDSKPEKIARCSITMKDFEDSKATVEQKQEYSTCVKLIYPKEMTSSEKQHIGMAGIGLTLFFVVVFILSMRKTYNDICESLCVAFFSVVCVLLSLGGVVLVYTAFQWAFGGG